MNTDNETLQDLARALDQAISSNSPAVRKQFEQLMVLLALTQSTGDNRLPGPFEQMIQNVEALARRCEQLEQRILQVELDKNTYKNPYVNTPFPGTSVPNQPIWTTTPGTSSPGYGAIPGTVPGAGNWTIGSVGSASDTITLTGAAGMSYDNITLSDYSYENNTMHTGLDVLSTKDLNELIEQMSITINKEKKNA